MRKIICMIVSSMIPNLMVSQPQPTGWESFGPPGPVWAIAVHPTNPNIILVGTQYSGIYRTLDGGESWHFSGHGLPLGEQYLSYFIQTIAFDPVNPTIAYAGTLESGFYKSSDGGVHWENREKQYSYDFRVGTVAIKVHPQNHNVVFRATAPGEGIYKSTDQAETWEVALRRSWSSEGSSDGIWDLWIDHDTVAAISYDATLWESTDNSQSWSATKTNLNDLKPQNAGLYIEKIVRDSFGNFYALHRAKGGVSISSNRRTWVARNNGIPLDHNEYFDDIAYDSVRHFLYVAVTDSGVYRSTNLGVQWEQVFKIPGASTLVTHGDVVFVGTKVGVYKSTDGGTIWASISHTLPTGIVVDFAISKADTNLIYAGTATGLFKSTTGGKRWEYLPQLHGANMVNAVAISPKDDNVIYVGFGGWFSSDFLIHGIYRSTDRGETWKNLTPPHTGSIAVTSIAIHPYNPKIMFFGSPGALWRSTDGGETWDLRQQRFGFSETETIAISSANPNIVYFGAYSNHDNGDNLGTFVSEDGGITWEQRRTMLFGSGIAGIRKVAIHPANASIAFAATTHGGFHRTTNLGHTWVYSTADTTSLTLGYAQNIHDFEFDDLFPNHVYTSLGASGGVQNGPIRGIYRSTDLGENWSRYIVLPLHLSLLTKFDRQQMGHRTVFYIATEGTGLLTNRFSESPIVTVEEPKLPPVFSELKNPFPNPVNSSIQIAFSLARSGDVSLKIFDILGREVATLLNEQREAGGYQVVWEASRFSSGVYFCRLSAGSFSATRRIVVIR